MPSKSINKTIGGLTVRLYVNKAEQLKAQRLLKLSIEPLKNLVNA